MAGASSGRDVRTLAAEGIVIVSPRETAFDGTLITGAWYVVTHFPSVIMWAVTLAILVLRALILLRQWRGG